MTTYKISGIWKNNDGVITHYAFHTVTSNGITRASKTSKSDAIIILSNHENTAKTWIWNYNSARFVDGQNVEVVGSFGNKYLRSDADNKLTDNLGHLINFYWIQQ